MLPLSAVGIPRLQAWEDVKHACRATLVNGRLGWTDIMGSGVAAALFGKNLLDRGHFVGGMTLAAALGHNAADVGEPRTYGLELTYRFR